MLQTVTHTPESAVHAMTEGSEALVWALEQGIITEAEYLLAEEPFDAATSKVFAVADGAAVA